MKKMRCYVMANEYEYEKCQFGDAKYRFGEPYERVERENKVVAAE